MTTLTRPNGAVYIIRQQETITQSPSLVLSTTVAPTVNTENIDIAGALEVYRGWVEFADEALMAPEKDWSDEAAKWTKGTNLTAALADLASSVSRHVRTVGHASHEAVVVSASINEVDLQVCTDASGVDVIDTRTGKSARASDGFRHPQWVTIVREADGQWFIGKVETQFAELC